jgi:tetratricopeptide (TPR) repeat protein
VLGLAHFGRQENEHSAREDYLVPVSVWAEGWPALEDLIVPLLDQQLRGAATVKRSTDLSVGLGADVVVAGYRPEVYAEREVDDLARSALNERGGVVVVGRPLSGKSRMAAEILREYPRALVVIPRAHSPAPPEGFEASGCWGEEAILLFDDLHRTAETSQTLAWRRAFEEATGRPCKVVCTSRDGEDWRHVEAEQGRLLQQLGEEARVFTSAVGEPGRQRGEDLPTKQARRLADELGMGAAEFEQRFDGTPGSLLLDLADMRSRYERLRDEYRGRVSMGRLLDSAKLLYRAWLPAFPDALVRAVVEQVRGTGQVDQETWETLLRRTREEGFVELDDESRTISFYPPYLERCVIYEPSAGDLERLSLLMEEAGDFVGLFFLVAFYRHDRKDYARALPLAERAIELNPNVALSWYNLSFTLNYLDRNEEALEAIERAISLDPEFDSYYYHKGWVLTDLGSHGEALKSFREALRRAGESYPRLVSMYLDGISASLAELGRFYEAVSVGLRSLSLYPPEPNAVGRLCNLLCAAREPAYALKVAEDALDLDHEWPEAWYGKGLALDELGRDIHGERLPFDEPVRDRESLKAYERATDLKHDLPEAWSRKGGTLLRMCQRVRASYGLAMALPQEDVDALAIGFARQGLDAIDTAISLGADQIENRWNRAFLLSHLDQHDEALDAFEGVLELAPDNPLIHHDRGRILRKAHRYDEALDAFEHSTWLDPTFPSPWWAMVVLLGGHFDRQLEALFAVDHLLKLYPGHVHYLFVRGCILAKLGRSQEARSLLRHARGHEDVLPLPGDPAGRRRSVLDFLGPEDP